MYSHIDYSNDSVKENIDHNRRHSWNIETEESFRRNVLLGKNTDTNSLAGEVIKLKKQIVEGEKERSRLQKDVSFLVP